MHCSSCSVVTSPHLISYLEIVPYAIRGGDGEVGEVAWLPVNLGSRSRQRGHQNILTHATRKNVMGQTRTLNSFELLNDVITKIS